MRQRESLKDRQGSFIGKDSKQPKGSRSVGPRVIAEPQSVVSGGTWVNNNATLPAELPGLL